MLKKIFNRQDNGIYMMIFGYNIDRFNIIKTIFPPGKIRTPVHPALFFSKHRFILLSFVSFDYEKDFYSTGSQDLHDIYFI
jgi:hypothetical protein